MKNQFLSDNLLKKKDIIWTLWFCEQKYIKMMKNIISRIVILYFLLLLLFSISVICVHCISKRYLYQNVKQSVGIIEREGIVHKMWENPFYRLDTYTDCLMFNEVLCADDNNPVMSAFANNFHIQAETTMLDDTKDVLKHKGENISLSSYARYWHGYMIVLRPLLTFTDYGGIRIINIFALFSLLLIISVLFYRKGYKKMSVTFLLTMLFVNLYVVANTIQFSTCFYISFMGILLILLYPTIVQNKNYILLFFGIGGITAFLDLLTTPLITLGLPLLTYLGIYSQKRTIIKTCVASISWGLGYGLIWASKWILSYIITGQNVLLSAENAAKTRVGRLNVINNIKWAVDIDLQKVFDSWSFYVIMLSILFLIILLLIYLKYKRCLYTFSLMKKYTYIIIIVSFVPIWFYILKNHSFVHFWFTWRNIVLPLWCILLYFSYWINIKGASR